MQIKENTNEIGSCGCGRSPTGFCIGWHGLTEDEFRTRLAEYDATQVKSFESPKDGV
jgi:hypothetical protein